MILASKKVVSDKMISDNAYLITHESQIDEGLTSSFGVDYFKLLNSVGESEDSHKQFKDVSIAISSAVNSYARIYMAKIKLDILKRGGNIYYSDTDSIVTDISLDSELIGGNIGQFKLEHPIKEGWFISNKTYCIIDDTDNVIIKSKGVDPKSLCVDDFKNFLQRIDVKGLKKFSTKDYTAGSVTLDEKYVNLHADSYKKRGKIYNEHNV
jgi:hypothetical protein